MGAKLVAEDGLLKGLVLSLGGEALRGETSESENGDAEKHEAIRQWVIGRDPDNCQLLVEDPAASRRHLICRVTPEGIEVENLSATNPIEVNGQEVTLPKILQNGDALRIGSGIFRFYSGEEGALIKEEDAEAQPKKEEENGKQEEEEESEAEPKVDLKPEEAVTESEAKTESEVAEHVPVETANNEESAVETTPEAISEEVPATEPVQEAESSTDVEEDEEQKDNGQRDQTLEDIPEADEGEEQQKEPLEHLQTQEPETAEHEPAALAFHEEPAVETTPEAISEEVPATEPVQEAESSTDVEEDEEQKDNGQRDQTLEDIPETNEREEQQKEALEQLQTQEPEDRDISGPPIEEDNAMPHTHSKDLLSNEEIQESSHDLKDQNVSEEASNQHVSEKLSEEYDPAREENETERDSIFEEKEEAKQSPMLAEINFDLTDTGRWLLKVVGGPNNGAEFSMQEGSSYIIGTDPNSSDVVLHDTSVSRQHARITVQDDGSITLEDLKSRNGTFVDGEQLHGSMPLPPNTLVAMGTSTFIVFDRDGEMKTIIAPLLPSIVKVLQKETPPGENPEQELAGKEELKPVETVKQKPQNALGAFIVLGMIIGMFVLAGIGTTLLFKNEPAPVAEQIDASKTISDALAPFPFVKWSFNKTTGRLLLVGHVLSASDKNQLMYNLQGYKFIKHIDDSGIVIDEYVWRETNQILEKNPNWKGITVYSPTPGHFVISGSLQTKAQADKLNDYLNANFPYLDLLDKRVVVEEEVMSSVSNQLINMGIRGVIPQVSGGDLTLTGTVPRDKLQDFEAALAEFKQIPGIRSVRNFTNQQAPEATMVNISDRYEVSGFSQSGSNVNVVINGRILSVGDVLDGMTLISIKPNTILFEKDGIKYKIDYSR